MTHKLRGREAEERQIMRILHTVTAGTSAVLHVEGGWGSGRTRLLQEAADAAGRLGFAVLTGDWSAETEPAALVGARASHGPVLVIQDDVHHADPEHVRSLCALPWQLRDQPVGWILSRRRHAGGPAADRLFARPCPAVARVDLRPLSAHANRQLAADHSTGATSDLLDLDLLRATGGNPLLTVELAQGMGGDPVSIVDPPPQSIQECVRRCMEELGVSCRQLLQVGAVLGVRFALSDVTRMLHRSATELLAPVEEALAAGVLTCAGDRLMFPQELFWRCVLASIPQPARTPMEQEAALVSSERDDAVMSEPSPSRFAGYRPNGAVLRPVDGALASGGRRLQPISTPANAQTRASVALRAILQGRAREARATATHLLKDSDLSRGTKDTATAAVLVAQSLLDGEDAAPAARQILRSGAHPAAGAAILMATTVLADHAWGNGLLEEGLRLAREATQQIRAATPALWQPCPRLALAQKLTDLREFDEARGVLRQTRQDLRPPVRPEAEAGLALVQSRLHLCQGRLASARHEAEHVLEFAQRTEARLLLLPALSVLAMIALRSDDLSRAAEHLHDCGSLLEADVAAPRSEVHAWAELLLTAERDGPVAAWTLLSERFPGQAIWRLFAEEAGAAAWLVRLALATDDRSMAETISEHVSRLAAKNRGVAVMTIAAEHAQALLDRDTGALAEVSERHPDPWARAWALEDLGSLLVDNDGAEAAIEHFTLAVNAFNRAGARRDATRVEERLRALGVRRAGRPGPGSRWDELSDTERSVAHLVSQGLTNRQIATTVYRSPHTVNYYLRQIFRKLDIRSRVELASLARDHSHYSDGLALEEGTLDSAG